jgi:hypothetical protein
MIYKLIGNAIINGLYVLAGAFVFNIIVSNSIFYFDKITLKFKDQRVSLASDVIDGAKSIKYLSWEKTFERKINELRGKEFKFIAINRMIDFFNVIFW